MRTDDKQRLEEQHKHLLEEFRSIGKRSDTGPLNHDDRERMDYLETQLRTINETLKAEHESELREIRNFGPDTAGFSPVGAGQTERLSPLFNQFQRAGWKPNEGPTEIEFNYRTFTWSGSVDNADINRGNDSAVLGYDSRYAYPAFTNVAIDRTVTSVQVLQQTARTLASTANVTRAVESVAAKPETSSTTALTSITVKQLANIQTAVPNLYAENPAIAAVIEADLKAALSDALDALVKVASDASGFQAPGTDPLLISIRKAMTTIMASGYNPDTVILTPANAEALDTLRTSGSELMWVFAAGGLAPRVLFGLQTRISKTFPAPVVVDSKAFGKMYTSPLSLASFEAGAGTTNTQNIRAELNAVFGTERQPAAVRIAAS
jgi:hypothetical protein